MKRGQMVLPVVAFTTGMIFMIFELVAARVLSPTLGTSIYVWTSVIGVMIAALSAGYWYGGRVADARGRVTDVAYLLLTVALGVAVTIYMYLPILAWLGNQTMDIRLKGVVAALLLFAPVSFLLGMVSPYLAKLRVTRLAATGRSIADLSALNSIGGITGTFLTGFVLFAYIGSREVLWGVSLVALALSWMIAPRVRMRPRAAISVVIIACCLLNMTISLYPHQIDTASAHYQIFDKYSLNGRQVRGITSGPGGIQSGVEVDNPQSLPFWYTRQFMRAAQYAPKKDRILMLGGGAYTVPRELARSYPQAHIDVVEIDGSLKDIAKRYFYYSSQPNIREITADAREYLNTTQSVYDIIYVDVYGDVFVPASLMTQEYAAQLKRVLASDGRVVVNSVAQVYGACRAQYEAFNNVYLGVFSHGIEVVERPQSKSSNIVSIYANQAPQVPGFSPISYQSKPAFTDNFSPIEPITQVCIQN